jgi:hypothetical protein
VLLETMQQDSHLITDLDLHRNPIGNEGASLLARSLGKNALPTLTRLSLSYCGIGDDGFIALVSDLEQNTSLLRLNLRCNFGLSKWTYLALAEILPEIKVLQRRLERRSWHGHSFSVGRIAKEHELVFFPH